MKHPIVVVSAAKDDTCTVSAYGFKIERLSLAQALDVKFLIKYAHGEGVKASLSNSLKIETDALNDKLNKEPA